jgi:nitrogen fixation NifU-like protein
VDAFSERLLKHVASPRHRGELPDANASASQSNPVCGDVLRLTLRVEGGTILAAAWEGKGCQASLGTNSLLVDTLQGMPVAEAKALSREAVEELAGGLPKSKQHCAVLAADTLRAALAAVPAASDA